MAASNHYVWLWLPGDVQPTLCGLLQWDGTSASFAYVRSYLANPRAISIQPSWPVESELGKRLFPSEDDPLPPVIADVAPGRWGEYVITKLRKGKKPNALEALLAGTGDRTGALEFSDSATEPPEVNHQVPTLENIASAVDELDKGRPVDPRLAALFKHGPSLGGRRPKATVLYKGSWWIAKFVSIKDRDLNQPRLEAFALAMAKKARIDIPAHRLEVVDGKPVLLVKRFDRGAGGERVHVLSARTLLNLSERQMLADASYPDVARALRQTSENAGDAARWYERMVFNIAIGNTDDHALNHLFGWDGKRLRLMPAFDLEPQVGATDPRAHEMAIGSEGKRGSFENAVSAHAEFGLSRSAAIACVRKLVASVRANWQPTLKEVGISDAQLVEQVRNTLLLDGAESF